MREILKDSNIAIVGGGRVCKAILKIILGEDFINQKLNILGVADINDNAKGLMYAREKGIFTTLRPQAKLWLALPIISRIS